MAKSKGLVFLVLGIALLIGACCFYGYNIAEDKNAGKAAADILEKFNELQQEAEEENTSSQPDSVPLPEEEIAPPKEEEDKVVFIDGEAFCGKLTVEKLSIELPIYDEWNYTRLKKAPCRYTGSIATGDMIIAGHNYKSHFDSLSKLEIGDSVIFTNGSGRKFVYEVKEKVTLDGTAVSDMQAGGWDLTLFTCTKNGKQRVTIRCELRE